MAWLMMQRVKEKKKSSMQHSNMEIVNPSTSGTLWLAFYEVDVFVVMPVV